MATAESSLRQRLRQTAVQAMLDAAEQAMVARGYDGATMAEIAAAAGCAIGTFYLHFKNKEELLQAIVARHAGVLLDAARSAMEGASDPVEKLRRSILAHIRYIQEHQAFFRLFFATVPGRHRTVPQRMGPAFRQLHEDYNAMEREVLRQAQAAGSIRDDLPPEVLQQFMGAVGFAMVEEFLFAHNAPPPEAQTRILWGLIARGIGACDAPA